MISLAEINALTGNRLGIFDLPCPVCGPERHSPINRHRKVRRIWRVEQGFATFHCARCGEGGHTSDPDGRRPDPAVQARVRAESLERERVSIADRCATAQWLWAQRWPIAGTIAETYLRRARGYTGSLPATLALLPARGMHGPAMIGAFGLANEPEPEVAQIDATSVRGVHITRLRADGLGKAGTAHDKIMIGPSLGSPIVLAPPNDLLGLTISEGIEDALSAHAATGLGAWAAGSASRMPALATAIPDYIEVVNIRVDDDFDGQRHAGELAHRIKDRGIEVRLITPKQGIAA